VRSVSELVSRRRARRWQRWTEVDPESDYARRAGIVAGVGVISLFVVPVAIVIALVLSR
jgi:hypothetical protein